MLFVLRFQSTVPKRQHKPGVATGYRMHHFGKLLPELQHRRDKHANRGDRKCALLWPGILAKPAQTLQKRKNKLRRHTISFVFLKRRTYAKINAR